jgi:hypothetical protein
MPTMLERIVAIVRRQPEGMKAHEVARALIAEPEGLMSDNRVGFCTSVLSGARKDNGELVFVMIGRGVYKMNELPPVKMNRNEWTLEMFAEEAFEKWWAEQGISDRTPIAFKDLAFKAFMAGYRNGDRNACPMAD